MCVLSGSAFWDDTEDVYSLRSCIFSVCVYVRSLYVCSYMCARVCAHGYARMCLMEARGQCQVSVNRSSPYFSRQRLSLNQELIGLDGLAGQWAPGTCFLPPARSGITWSHLAFYLGCEDLAQVLELLRKHWQRSHSLKSMLLSFPLLAPAGTVGQWPSWSCWECKMGMLLSHPSIFKKITALPKGSLSLYFSNPLVNVRVYFPPRLQSFRDDWEQHGKGRGDCSNSGQLKTVWHLHNVLTHSFLYAKHTSPAQVHKHTVLTIVNEVWPGDPLGLITV